MNVPSSTNPFSHARSTLAQFGGGSEPLTPASFTQGSAGVVFAGPLPQPQLGEASYAAEGSAQPSALQLPEAAPGILPPEPEPSTRLLPSPLQLPLTTL